MWLLMIVLSAITLGILGAFLFQVVDSTDVKQVPMSGVVRSRAAVPESVVTSFIQVGDIQVPQIQTYPPSWVASVEIEGYGVVNCDITESQYAAAQSGKDVVVGVASGRFSGAFYCGDFKFR